jgi:hypothetical protein
MKFCDTSGVCSKPTTSIATRPSRPAPTPSGCLPDGETASSRQRTADAAKVDVRVAAFVKELTLEGKAGIMINNGKGVKRLHLPPYQWGSEGLHGPLQPCVPASDGTTKCPTSFPAPSAMAPAFNDTLCAPPVDELFRCPSPCALIALPW